MRSDVEACRSNGWGPGTRLVGDEGDGPTVIEIRYVGDEVVVARKLSHRGEPVEACDSLWTLGCRHWTSTTNPGTPAAPVAETSDEDRPDVEGFRRQARLGFGGLLSILYLCKHIDHLERSAPEAAGLGPDLDDAICFVKAKEDELWAKAHQLEGEDKDDAELAAMRWWKVRELLLELQTGSKPAPIQVDWQPFHGLGGQRQEGAMPPLEGDQKWADHLCDPQTDPVTQERRCSICRVVLDLPGPSGPAGDET